jgi:hypothetical protein
MRVRPLAGQRQSWLSRFCRARYVLTIQAVFTIQSSTVLLLQAVESVILVAASGRFSLVLGITKFPRHQKSV